MDLRVRRRDLKVGRVFICKTEGGIDHPTHSCPAGEPVIVNCIFEEGTRHSGRIPVPVVCNANFTKRGEVMKHNFRLADIRKVTPEEWGI